MFYGRDDRLGSMYFKKKNGDANKEKDKNMENNEYSEHFTSTICPLHAQYTTYI